jgi:hypothetical protein
LTTKSKDCARNAGAAERIHVAAAGHRHRHADWIVSSDSEVSVQQVLGATASLIDHFDCGASLFGKQGKFRRVVNAVQIGRSSGCGLACLTAHIRNAPTTPA